MGSLKGWLRKSISVERKSKTSWLFVTSSQLDIDFRLIFQGKNMKIEDLYLINKKLSAWHLFLRFWRWYDWVVIIPFGLCIIVMFSAGMIYQGTIKGNLIVFASTVPILLFFFLIQSRIEPLIKERYAYAYSKKEKLFKMTEQIQTQEFKQQVKSQSFFENDNLDFVISAVVRDYENRKKYLPFWVITNFILPIFIGLSAVFIAGGTKDIQDFDIYMKTFGTISSVLVMLGIVSVFAEMFIIREFLLWRKREYLRLLRILENLRFENSIWA